MKYRGKTIPFPVLRLGNTEKVMEAIKYINELRTQVQSLQILLLHLISGRMIV